MSLALGSGSNGFLASNYTLTQSSLGTVTVTPAALTITGLSGTDKTYDGTTSDPLSGTAVFTGLVNGQTVAVTGTLANAAAGSEAVSLTLGNGSNGFLASNYTLTQSSLGTVMVTPAALTITGLSGTDKTYDGTTSDPLMGKAVFTGLVNGQTVAVTGTLANADAGSEAVSLTLGSGSNGFLASNYTLTQSSLGTVMVTPAALTITGLSGTDKIFDGTTSDTLTGTPVIHGLVNGQTVTLEDDKIGTLASASTGREDVSTDITLGSGANGWLAGNYTLIQPTLAPVEVSPVFQKTPTVTVTLLPSGKVTVVINREKSASEAAFGYLGAIASSSVSFDSLNAAETYITAFAASGGGDGLQLVVITGGGVKKPNEHKQPHLAWSRKPALQPARQEAAATARQLD